VKPEFWRDAELASLSDSSRLFFIGLWNEADDTGWVRWSVPEIAADLYPYRAVRTRERDVERHALALLGLPSAHFAIAECGRHALIPGLPQHQLSQGGNKASYVLNEHLSRCVENPVDTVDNGQVRTGTDIYGRKGRERKGREGNFARARARGAMTDAELDDLLSRSA
jgi:hypothetical protein